MWDKLSRVLIKSLKSYEILSSSLNRLCSCLLHLCLLVCTYTTYSLSYSLQKCPLYCLKVDVTTGAGVQFGGRWMKIANQASVCLRVHSMPLIGMCAPLCPLDCCTTARHHYQFKKAFMACLHLLWSAGTATNTLYSGIWEMGRDFNRSCVYVQYILDNSLCAYMLRRNSPDWL